MEKGERRKEKGERRKEKGERRTEKGERRKQKGERRKEKGMLLFSLPSSFFSLQTWKAVRPAILIGNQPEAILSVHTFWVCWRVAEVCAFLAFLLLLALLLHRNASSSLLFFCLALGKRFFEATHAASAATLRAYSYSLTFGLVYQKNMKKVEGAKMIERVKGFREFRGCAVLPTPCFFTQPSWRAPVRWRRWGCHHGNASCFFGAPWVIKQHQLLVMPFSPQRRSTISAIAL